MDWYTKVTQNLANLPDFLSYCDAELQQAKFEVGIKGNVERHLALLPGVTEHRFNQLQVVEAVLNFLNIQLRQTRSKTFKKYLENYQRELSSRDCERYVDGEPDVIAMESLVNEVALMRNKWLGVMKGLEAKQWQLGHLIRLKCAGMEDYTI